MFPVPVYRSIGLIIHLSMMMLFSHMVSAQTYQPFPTEQATWKVARCWYFFQPGWHDTYELTMNGSDTLYQGEMYKQIWITQHLIHGTAFDSLYPPIFFGGLREMNKRIYIFQSWGTVDTTAHLMYDFNQNHVGDIIYTSALFGPASNMYGHVITSLDSVLVGGIYHKRFHLQNPDNPFETEQWIEGIGSLWGLPFATVWSITDNSYDLACFYRNGHLSYLNPSPTFGYCQGPLPDISCDSLLNSTETGIPQTDMGLAIFPNPASQQVTIQAEDAHYPENIQIWTSTGQLVGQQIMVEGQARIDVADWTPGLYIITGYNRDRMMTGKLLISR